MALPTLMALNHGVKVMTLNWLEVVGPRKFGREPPMSPPNSSARPDANRWISLESHYNFSIARATFRRVATFSSPASKLLGKSLR